MLGTTSTESVAQLAEELRKEVCASLGEESRSKLGQFLTPEPVARLIAECFDSIGAHVVFLDAGAGLGTLTAAFVEELLRRADRPNTLHLEAWELEPAFADGLRLVLEGCVESANASGIKTTFEIHRRDFIQDASLRVREPLFQQRRFTHAAMNPPYGKINSTSAERHMLRSAGLETSNLYAGFVWLASKLLEEGGELVAITPRSFCSGPYFFPFRRDLLETASLRRVWMFDRRDDLFARDAVLQETLVFHAVKGGARKEVQISRRHGDGESTSHAVPYSHVVSPVDPHQVIHLPSLEQDAEVNRLTATLPDTLDSLGLNVSTGRVVPFRARGYLHQNPAPNTVPLIYPKHIRGGVIRWPLANFRKFNAITDGSTTADLRVANGIYVIAKRFTAKEERRRVVAGVYRPNGALSEFNTVGFENHLNYFHRAGAPLEEMTARGLAVFLNSTMVDNYFRQFNGHTQVNAGDLRRLRYPSHQQLLQLATIFSDGLPDQQTLDTELQTILFRRTEKRGSQRQS